LLRLLYADHGSLQDLDRAVAAARDWAVAETVRGLAQLEEYRNDGGPFPDQLHISVLFADLCGRLFEAVDEWAMASQAEIATWPRTDGVGATPGTTRRLDDLIKRSRRLLARARPRDPR
jgi:PadR family transcriptional regulator, regulatory protein AphA